MIEPSIIDSLTTIIEIVVIGVIATLAMDLWQRLIHAIAGLPPANWELIGRWGGVVPAQRLRPSADHGDGAGAR